MRDFGHLSKRPFAAVAGSKVQRSAAAGEQGKASASAAATR